MNTILKITVGSALALGAVSANASIGTPSTGSSDAVLFAEVLNSSGTVVASYAGDTGVSISSIASGSYAGGTVLDTSNFGTLWADANVAGNTLYWGVEGGQYTGNATVANFKSPSASEWVTTTSVNSTASFSGKTTTNLTHWTTWNTDEQTIFGSTATSTVGNVGSGVDVISSSLTTGGLWDVNTPTGIFSWYANGPQAAVTATSGISLFAVTGGGTTTSPLAVTTTTYNLGIGANGLTIAASAVPLPPAVWLLGSGLLGLAGVARRKSMV
jgi:hypothetical protein